MIMSLRGEKGFGGETFEMGNGNIVFLGWVDDLSNSPKLLSIDFYFALACCASPTKDCLAFYIKTSSPCSDPRETI